MSTIYQDIGDYRCLEQNPGLNRELARNEEAGVTVGETPCHPFFFIKKLRLVAYLAGEDFTNKKATSRE
jgi:hypothetical protein